MCDVREQMLLCFEGRVFHLMCLDFKGSVLFTQGKYVMIHLNVIND